MKLQFKFRESIGEVSRKRFVETLGRRGATAVRPLFPGETEAGLAALYVVECEEEGIGRRLLDLLLRSREVEFAEPEVRRKLIR